MILKTPKIQIIKSKLSLKIILISFLLILIIVSKYIIFSKKFDQIPFDQYETNIFNNIKDKLYTVKPHAIADHNKFLSFFPLHV